MDTTVVPPEATTPKITIEVVQKAPDVPAPDPGMAAKDSGIDYRFNPEYHRFCDDLGLERNGRENPSIANKVSYLYDWAKENSESEDGTKISAVIKDLTQKLGYSYRGEVLIDSLYQWTRLESDSQRLRMRELEGEMVEKQLEVKQKIKTIEPKISEQELEKRVKEGMKETQKAIKRRVQSHITQAINKGIRDALSRATPK